MFRCLKFRKKVLICLIIFCIVCNSLFIYALRFLLNPENVDCKKFSRDLSYTPSFENELFGLSKNSSVKQILSKTKRWFQVSRDTFIYSAYENDCPPDVSSSYCVQFIGIGLHEVFSESQSQLKCSFRTDSGIIRGDFAVIERLNEGHGLNFTAAFFYCSMKNLKGNYPEYASLYPNQPKRWFPVERINANKRHPSISLSLCVRPLFGHYTNLQLTQFFLYYATMGVDHFILYNYNASDSTLQYLNFIGSSYVNFSLLPWNIPLNNSEVHEYGQMVFTQDCLARSRNEYSHTVIVDLDEYIVPKEHKTIVDLVTYLDICYPYAGSYVVPMVAFCEEYIFERNESLPLLKSNKRQKTSWAHGYRSKYIARPQRVHYGGVHMVWEFKNGYREVELPPSIALLHHYKLCCEMVQTWFFHLFKFNVLSDEIVIDDTLPSSVPEIFNYSLIRRILNSKIAFKKIRSLM